MRNPFKTILRRAANWLVKNWYDAGFPLLDGDRSWIPAVIADARYDQNPVTRREMLRKARNFYQNNGIVKSIIDIKGRYIIGPGGPHLTPATSDSEWNERAQTAWYEFTRNCGFNGESLYQLLDVGHIMEGVDGEIFYLKTRIKTPRGSRPAFQAVEAHRVETPMAKWGEENRSIYDGLQLGPNGERMGWYVRTGLEMFEQDQSFDLKPFDSVIHVFAAHRVNQFRGLSRFFPVLNDAHHIDDMEKLEGRAMADASEKSTFIKTAGGELDKDQLRQRRYTPTSVTAPPAPANGPDPLGTRVDYLRSIIGGRTVGLKIGEDVSQFMPMRPSEGTRWYWGYKTAKVCAALGTPKILIFPETLQGTVLRAVIADADAEFTRQFQLWSRVVREMYEYWLDWARYNDPRLVDAPADWKECIIHQPRKLSVDVGYDSAATLNELAAGKTTFAAVCGADGRGWKEVFRQRKREQDFAKEIGLVTMFPNQPQQFQPLAPNNPATGASGTPNPELDEEEDDLETIEQD